MQHTHLPLPPHGGAFANIPDRVFDRGARLGLVIASINAPFNAAFEIPQPRDVALASGAVAGSSRFCPAEFPRGVQRKFACRTPSYEVGNDDQPDEGPAPGMFGKLLGLASVPPIQLVNLALAAKSPNAPSAAPIGAFSAVAVSSCASPVSLTALTR